MIYYVIPDGNSQLKQMKLIKLSLKILVFIVTFLAGLDWLLIAMFKFDIPTYFFGRFTDLTRLVYIAMSFVVIALSFKYMKNH